MSELQDNPVDGGWREVIGIDTATFYAMADLDIAKTIGGSLWLGGAVVAGLLIPIAPLDDTALGNSGTFVGAAIVLFALGYSLRLFRFSAGVGVNEMLALNYVALVLISTLMWLHGSFAPYTELLVLPMLYTAAVHPPRRVLLFVGVTGLALALPLFYAEEQTFAEEFGRFVLWSGLAIAATAYTAKVRIDRHVLLTSSGEAHSEARVDSLTGLGNRRAYDEGFAAAAFRSSRTGSDLSLVIADLDSFKLINDRFGLPAGDRCLQEVALVIAEAVRRPDSCFRWGGDEFMVLADVDRDGADALAERLSEAVSARCRRPDGSPVLLHVGAAQFGRDGKDAAELLAAASGALKAGEETSFG